MPKVTQLAVTLENKPGALAQICSTLGKAGVNISAVLAPEIKVLSRNNLITFYVLACGGGWCSSIGERRDAVAS